MPDLSRFLDGNPQTVLVSVKAAKGSTPRDTDAWMLVSAGNLFGTIGGGQLEFLAIDRARLVLSGQEKDGDWSQPLGPEIGQCCGGHVTLGFRLLDGNGRAALLADWRRAMAALPGVYLFGAGHVGTALAQALVLLPVRVTVVETRADALDGLPDAATAMLAPLPEAIVRDAPAGSAFIVLTHDHALDFLIVSEALNLGGAAYVGMIGSVTKRAVFCRSFLQEGGSEDRLAKLTCPIGGSDVRDKRPAVIAALTAAEVLRALVSQAHDPC